MHKYPGQQSFINLKTYEFFVWKKTFFFGHYLEMLNGNNKVEELQQNMGSWYKYSCHGLKVCHFFPLNWYIFVFHYMKRSFTLNFDTFQIFLMFHKRKCNQIHAHWISICAPTATVNNSRYRQNIFNIDILTNNWWLWMLEITPNSNVFSHYNV